MKSQQHSTPLSRQRAFTLIEVMVVVVILGILAAVVVPRVLDRPDQARITAARQDIAQIMQARIGKEAGQEYGQKQCRPQADQLGTGMYVPAAALAHAGMRRVSGTVGVCLGLRRRAGWWRETR